MKKNKVEDDNNSFSMMDRNIFIENRVEDRKQLFEQHMSKTKNKARNQSSHRHRLLVHPVHPEPLAFRRWKKTQVASYSLRRRERTQIAYLMV